MIHFLERFRIAESNPSDLNKSRLNTLDGIYLYQFKLNATQPLNDGGLE